MPKQTFFNLPEEKRQMIVDLAIDEFAENDYNNASISRMVSAAGIAKGSFYQYFEDKRDLYFYLLDLASQEKLNFIRNIEAPDPQMGLFNYLRWLFKVSLRFQFAHPRLNQVAYRAIYGDAPFRSETLNRLKQAAMDYYRQLVIQGVNQGDIHPEIDPDLAAFVLSSTINELGNHLMAKLEIDPKDLIQGQLSSKEIEQIEEIVNQLIDVLEQGLKRAPVHQSP